MERKGNETKRKEGKKNTELKLEIDSLRKLCYCCLNENFCNKIGLNDGGGVKGSHSPKNEWHKME